jgi:hypothetical protein
VGWGGFCGCGSLGFKGRQKFAIDLFGGTAVFHGSLSVKIDISDHQANPVGQAVKCERFHILYFDGVVTDQYY